MFEECGDVGFVAYEVDEEVYWVLGVVLREYFFVELCVDVG